MLNFFIKRPVTTVMFVFFWVVLGIVSFPKMNIERTPAIDFPMVSATFVYPDASSVEIESQVIKKAEDAVSQIAGVKKITSQVFENAGIVMTEFNLGVNVNDKASELKSKLDSISAEFPDDLEQPVVEKLNPLAAPVMDIVLSGASLKEMDFYADKILSNKITGIKGVASADIFGGQKRAIRVSINPENITAFGITISDIVSTLSLYNLNVPGGKIEYGSTGNNIRFTGEFQSIEDIKGVRITTAEGQNIALSDIAKITDDVRDIETGARYNGNDVVILSVVKASDGNSIKISKDISKILPDLTQDIQNYFGSETVNMEVISDSSIAVLNETNSTIYGIVLGLMLTILILFFFTRNWRSTVIAGVVIPSSLIASFFFMNSAGFTINAMTLLACSAALGTLISNAIVLIE